MLSFNTVNSYKSRNKLLFFNNTTTDESRNQRTIDATIIVNQKKCKRLKTNQQQNVIFRSSRLYKFKKRKVKRRSSSVLKINNFEKSQWSCDISNYAVNKQIKCRNSLFQLKYVVSMMFGRPFNTALSLSYYPDERTWKTYKCQVCYNCIIKICGDQKLQDEGDVNLPVEFTTKAIGYNPLNEVLTQKIKAPKTILDAKLVEDVIPPSGKTQKQRENLLRSLVRNGLPLPKGRTLSEKKLIDKVQVDLGIQPETEKIFEFEKEPPSNARFITIFEGKPLKKDSQVAGDPISKDAILLKKDHINKLVKYSVSKHEILLDKVTHNTSFELLTLLKDTLDQKEQVIRDLVKGVVLPLPEPRTASEQYLIDRIKNKRGLAFQRNKSSESLTLKNMTQIEKEIILERLKAATSRFSASTRKSEDENSEQTMQTDQAVRILTLVAGPTSAQKKLAVGISLPEGRTNSEKALFGNIKHAEKVQNKSHVASTSSQSVTPLEGNPKTEKKKIVKNLAEAGLFLPESKWTSEKSLIRNNEAEMAIPQERTHAKVDGLFIQITGNPYAVKERIPEGKTASEKDLVKTIGNEFKRYKKAKRKKKKENKEEEINTQRIRIAENYQAVIKTCERGCGCNKRNMKLKDSHTKAKVVFPDLPFVCYCPGECIPNGNSGKFVQNKGTKMVVGDAVGVPAISREYIKQIIQDGLASKRRSSHVDTDHSKYLNDSKNIDYNNFKNNFCDSRANNFIQTQCYRCVGLEANMKCFKKSAHIYRNDRSLLKSKSASSRSGSILVINSKSSLSSVTSSGNSIAVSVTSDLSSDVSFASSHYSGSQSSEEIISISSLEGSTSCSEELMGQPGFNGDRKKNKKMNISTINPQLEYAVFRLSEDNHNFDNRKTIQRPRPVTGNVVLFNRFSRKFDISKLLDKILARKRFTDVPSLFLVAPTSDEEEESTKVVNSTSICSVATPLIANSDTMTAMPSVHEPQRCGKGKKFFMREVLSAARDREKGVQKDSLRVLKYVNMETRNKYCQFVTTSRSRTRYVASVRNKAVDTTVDRPCCCCCAPKISSTTYTIEKDTSRECYIPNLSRQVTPLLLKDKRPKWCRFPKLNKAPKKCAEPERPTSILVPCISSQGPSSTCWRYRKYPRPSSVSINESLNKYNYITEPLPCECNSSGFESSLYQTGKVTVGRRYNSSLNRMGRRRSIDSRQSCSSSSSSESDNNVRRRSVTIVDRRNSMTRSSSDVINIAKRNFCGDTNEPVRKSSLRQRQSGIQKTRKHNNFYGDTNKPKRKSSLKRIISGSVNKMLKKQNECGSCSESTSEESSKGFENLAPCRKPPKTADACFGTASAMELVCRPPPEIKPCKQKPPKRKPCGCKVVKGSSCACVEHYVIGGPGPGPAPWTHSRGMVTDLRGPAIINARKLHNYNHILCDKDIETCLCRKKICVGPKFQAICPCGDHTDIISCPDQGPTPSTYTVGTVTDVMGSDLYNLELAFCPTDPTVQTKEKKKCKRYKGCVCKDLQDKGTIPPPPECDFDCTYIPKPKMKKRCIDKGKIPDSLYSLDQKHESAQTEPGSQLFTKITKFFSNIGTSLSKVKLGAGLKTCFIKEKVFALDAKESPIQANYSQLSILKKAHSSPLQADTPRQADGPRQTDIPRQAYSPRLADSPRQADIPRQAHSPRMADSPVQVESIKKKKVKPMRQCECRPVCNCRDCILKRPVKPKKPCLCKPVCRCIACTLSLDPIVTCECTKGANGAELSCECTIGADGAFISCECKKEDEKVTCECKEKPVKCECEIQCLCKKISKSKNKSVTLIDPKAPPSCAIKESDLKEPEPEPEPEPDPIQKLELEPDPREIIELPPECYPEGQLYETLGPSCMWIKDTEALLKIRSDLTMTSSGFKAFKAKRQPKPPQPEIELDFAQAIRYFASLNPVRFRELMVQERKRQNEEIRKQKEYEEQKRKEAEAIMQEEEARKKVEQRRRENVEKLLRYLKCLRRFKKYLAKEEIEKLETLEQNVPEDLSFTDMGAEADLDPTYWYPPVGFKLTVGPYGGATPGNPNVDCR